MLRRCQICHEKVTYNRSYFDIKDSIDAKRCHIWRCHLQFANLISKVWKWQKGVEKFADKDYSQDANVVSKKQMLLWICRQNIICKMQIFDSRCDKCLSGAIYALQMLIVRCECYQKCEICQFVVIFAVKTSFASCEFCNKGVKIRNKLLIMPPKFYFLCAKCQTKAWKIA